MIIAVKSEWTEMAKYVRNNRFELAVIGLGVLFLLCSKFNWIRPLWLNYMVFYFILPVLSLILIFRRNPFFYGFQLGNYKIWGAHLLVVCPVIALFIYLNSRTVSVVQFYGSQALNLNFMLEMAAVLFAWEYICRGYFIFGLKDSLREGAIMVQMIPFVLLHVGKPEVETITCIASGLYFGYLAYRGNSFWPAFILHYFMTMTNQIWVT